MGAIVRIRWAALAAILTASGSAAPAGATTLELWGFGPRLIALANASEAAADDYFAAYANPANLALDRRLHFGYGGDVVIHRTSIDRRGGDARWPTRLPPDSILAHVGVSSPLPGWFHDKAAIGIAVHVPIAGPTRLDSLDHRIPQLPLYDSLGDRLALVVAAAARPVSWLAIGAGAQVLTALGGRADIGLSVLDQRVTYKALEVDLATVVVPMVGATVSPAPGVRIAAVWRAQSDVRYELPLHVAIERVGVLDFRVKGVGLWLPESIAVASSWRRAAWLATASLAWQRWSAMPPLAPDVTVRIDDRELAQPGSTIVELLYAHNVPVAMGAKDIAVPRVGVEWSASPTWTLRAGAQHRPTPLPKADGEANYLDAPATTVAVGAGFELGDPLGLAGKPLQVDLAVAWSGLARRTVVKRDGSDPVGATSLSGDAWHIAVAVHHDF